MESLTKYEKTQPQNGWAIFLLLHSVGHPAQIPHIGGVGGQNNLIAQQRCCGRTVRQEGANGRIIHIARAQRQQRFATVRLDAAVLDVYGTELTADDLQPAAPVGSLVRFVLPVLGTEQG